jgi:cyclopropane-fatty-acyl-phospholipid synthase
MTPPAKGGAAQVIATLLKTHPGLDLPVRLRLWDGSEAGPDRGPVLIVRTPQALRRILWRPGELGLARAYISGDLDLEGDLTEALRLVRQAFTPAATPPRPTPPRPTPPSPASPRPTPPPPASRPPASRARAARTLATHAPAVLAALRAAARLKILGPPWRPPPPPGCELRVHGRLHSRARDQAVVAGHYDLPAAFYQLILDASMAYSCAYWPGADTLAHAQQNKLDLISSKLDLRPGARLLDLGCGWGSLTVHAARDRQAQVTAVTLSGEQGGYTRQRLRDLDLTERAEVLIQDYRDTAGGPYDAVVSVEMGEHVGAAGYPAFCAALYRLLRPGGRLLIQQMSRHRRTPGGGPFIESYIAPDMHMRPVGETVRLIEDAGFEVIDVEAMRLDYVRTIRAWQANFEQNLPAVQQLLTAEQVRVWRLYLAGSAMAFEDGRMGVDQILAVRPGPASPANSGPVGPASPSPSPASPAP